MSREIDVAVIGGGPAGATAARLLTEWGHNVVLFHRRAPGGALGESLPPSALGLLERVGLQAAMDGAGFLRSTGNTVWWGANESRPRLEPFPDGRLGYQVLRPTFDRLLRREARRAGVSIRSATVTGVTALPDGCQHVQWHGPAGPDGFAARWVLDCTGRAGLVARHAGRRPEPGVRTLALAGMWTRPDGWPIPEASHTLVESFTDGWGWSIPVSETTRCVALMLDPTHGLAAGGRRPDLGALLRDALSRTRLLGPLLTDAQPDAAPFACDASPYSATRVVLGRTLLVGDAASFIDPLSSFGVKKALASAWLAAVSVHSALTTPACEQAALALFEDREVAYVTAARRELGAVSRDARGGDGFWGARSALGQEGDDELEASALREDPEVLAAFAELKARPVAVLRRGPGAIIQDCAVIVGNRIELHPHFLLPGHAAGVRFLRNVDLVELSAIAPQHGDVGEMYEAYCRRVAAAPLPDFLGALSTMIARGMLQFA